MNEKKEQKNKLFRDLIISILLISGGFCSFFFIDEGYLFRVVASLLLLGGVTYFGSTVLVRFIVGLFTND